jgi:hypothetical protein
MGFFIFPKIVIKTVFTGKNLYKEFEQYFTFKNENGEFTYVEKR